MFLNYLSITIFIIHLSCCVCYVNYDQFPGFDMNEKKRNSIRHLPASDATNRKQVPYSARQNKMSPTATPKKTNKFKKHNTTITSKINKQIKTVRDFIYKEVYDKILHGKRPPPHKITTGQPDDMGSEEELDMFSNSSSVDSSQETKLSTKTDKFKRRTTTPTTARNETTNSTTPLIVTHTSVKHPKFNCTEYEKPFNIGTYEVPTQRDVVLQIQKTLKRMFGQYREKALDFLQDIHQATEATLDVEKKCRSNEHNHRKSYRRCVKVVSKKCEYITKSLIISLEQQRADVSAFVEGTICNGTNMKSDPLELIKSLAMELASLEFALPGFLRLLGSCSTYCDTSLPANMRHKKPIRHMTDQDLVVKHFLTKKSYVQLIN